MIAYLQDHFQQTVERFYTHAWLAVLPLVIGLVLAIPLGWLASRYRRVYPGVINLAGRTDMTVGIEEYESGCFMPVLHELIGGTPSEVPDRYAQVSLPALLPIGVRQTLIWGSLEDYVPETQAREFVAAARAAGDDAKLVIVPGAGHFETASPTSPAWSTVLAEIRSMLAP